MQSVLGTAEENGFVNQVRMATAAYRQLAQVALRSLDQSIQAKPPAPV
jgi:hypothetical protein